MPFPSRPPGASSTHLLMLSQMSASLMDPCPGLRTLRQGLYPVHLSISVPGTEPGPQRALVFGDEGREEKDGVEWVSSRGNGGDTFPAAYSQGRTATSLHPAQKRRPWLHGDSRASPWKQLQESPGYRSLPPDTWEVPVFGLHQPS